MGIGKWLLVCMLVARGERERGVSENGPALYCTVDKYLPRILQESALEIIYEFSAKIFVSRQQAKLLQFAEQRQEK
jgi:hypothetical protein